MFCNFVLCFPCLYDVFPKCLYFRFVSNIHHLMIKLAGFHVQFSHYSTSDAKTFKKFKAKKKKKTNDYLFYQVHAIWPRLQAVPFWSVERVRSQRSETGARRNKQEASPQAPLRSFAPVFSHDLSTIQKWTACSLNLATVNGFES